MRGGKRDGAGRPAGSSNTATAASKAALADLAAGYVEGALVALADIAANGTSDAARVSAAVAILDRCYGRPRQIVEHDGTIGGHVTSIERVIVQASARNVLAEHLERIADRQAVQ